MRLVNQGEIVIGRLPIIGYSGATTIALQHNGGELSNEVPIQIPAPSRLTPALCAAFIFSIVILILVFLAWRGSGRKIAGQSHSLLNDKGALLTAGAGATGTAVPAKDATLQVVKKDSTNADPKMAAQLRLVLKDKDKIIAVQNAMAPALNDPAVSPPILMVTNDDGHAASWPLNRSTL